MDLNKWEPFYIHGESRVVVSMDKHFAASLTRRLEPYKNIPSTFKPALEDIANYYRTVMIPKVFKQEGPGWAPLAPRTVKERVAAGFQGRHPILKRTGDLMKELSDRTHPKHFEVIKVGKNSRIEIGGTSKKFMENQMGNPATHLPARPMLGNSNVSATDRMQMRNILETAMKKRLNRGI